MATPIPPSACPLTLGEIARATGGTINPGVPESLAVRGVSIDTRTIARGAMFVALRGVAQDGHAYIAHAAQRGAAAAIVERGRSASSLPSVEVADTLTALGDLARFHLGRERAARPIPSFAVVGSAGKTTTKEIVAALARALFGTVLSTPGNLNNLIGVPMTLFTLASEHRALVIECGTSRPGEIRRLGAILKPEVALVLNVDIEHSEGLGTIDEIADEETSIFACTTRTAVAPVDDVRISIRIPPRLRRITFGDSAQADVRLARRAVTSQARCKVLIEIGAGLVEPGVAPRIEADLCLLGAQSALNAAAAVACGAALRARPFAASELRSIQ
jgi:UDP-N-acetylmuramoyl-tripeptide--D-alanyl-D-alanine ligase